MFKLFKKIDSITVHELQKMVDKPITLLDVRSPGEYRGGHIYKAKNIPLAKLVTYQGNPAEVTYLICQSGMRSQKGAKMLQKRGYQVVNVRGGMNQWTGKVRGGK